MIYVSNDGTPTGSGPALFLQAGRDSVLLPPNPRALQWRYVATVGAEDKLFARHGDNAVEAVRSQGYFMAADAPFN